jgi:hypothetical protein
MNKSKTKIVGLTANGLFSPCNPSSVYQSKNTGERELSHFLPYFHTKSWGRGGGRGRGEGHIKLLIIFSAKIDLIFNM